MDDNRRSADLSGDRTGILESTLHGVSDAVGYHEWLADRIAGFLEPPVLEIGAGLGGLTRALAPRIAPLLASEPDESLRAELEALDVPGITTVQPLSLPLQLEPSFAVEPKSIVMSNVLEHIYCDEEALCSLLEVSTANRLAVVVPAHQWAYTGLDAALGHHRRYTVRSLTGVLAAAGWIVDDSRYFNPIGAIAWTLSGRVLGRATIEPWQTKAVERTLPLLKLVDGLLRGRVFGQSIIALARRAEPG